MWIWTEWARGQARPASITNMRRLRSWWRAWAVMVRATIRLQLRQSNECLRNIFSTVVSLCLSDPMQTVLQALERRHKEEKRSALERQRLLYEEELQRLRRRLSPQQRGSEVGIPSSSSMSSSPKLQSHQWHGNEERWTIRHHLTPFCKDQLCGQSLHTSAANKAPYDNMYNTRLVVIIQL